jgi:putative restriction endonuclease
MTYPDPLSQYLHTFANLRRHKNQAPHKPILLLAILHEIDTGRITADLITPSPELVAAFRLYWDALVPPDSGYQERMAYPFRYLRQDGFWELVVNSHPVPPEPNRDYTLNQLATSWDGGMFDDALWQLLIAPSTRAIFRQHLLSTYFNGAIPTVTSAQQSTYLYAQAQKLKLQAKAKFVRKRVKEPSDEGYYVRNRLFPEVVKELYSFSCCVCRLNTNMGNNRSVVDGAHIMPFAEFHNNDPRNGISLCRNHHWGFDSGAWSLTDDQRIIVSPNLNSPVPYLVANSTIHLPADEEFWPDPVALEWHRKRWGF